MRYCPLCLLEDKKIMTVSECPKNHKLKGPPWSIDGVNYIANKVLDELMIQAVRTYHFRRGKFHTEKKAINRLRHQILALTPLGRYRTKWGDSPFGRHSEDVYNEIIRRESKGNTGATV